MLELKSHAHSTVSYLFMLGAFGVRYSFVLCQVKQLGEELHLFKKVSRSVSQSGED